MLREPIFNLMFSESKCSGVSKISNHFLFQAIWVNKSLSMMWVPSPTSEGNFLTVFLQNEVEHWISLVLPGFPSLQIIASESPKNNFS
jgi:hypothetical protein